MTTYEIAARLEPRNPAVASMLTEAGGELTAVTAFQVSHWPTSGARTRSSE